jgi:thiol-disulfide isomerase/thioredoxin
VEENSGESALAKRFGVTRYPAIFVDDVLVATPNDFGFYGNSGGTGGRYSPWVRNAASQERFRADLTRMVDLLLTNRKAEAQAQAAPAGPPQIAELPPITFTDLDGKRLTRRDLAGRVVLVEVWATWCVPCRPTLSWLGELKKRHGDRLAVITVAIESSETDVRQVAEKLQQPFVWTMGTPETVRALGDVSAVPALLLFDRDGRTAATFFGAPPSLHAEAEAKIASLVQEMGQPSG